MNSLSDMDDEELDGLADLIHDSIERTLPDDTEWFVTFGCLETGRARVFYTVPSEKITILLREMADDIERDSLESN